MGDERYAAVPAENVIILDSAPAWSYSEIGYVQTKALAYPVGIEVYSELQKLAGDIGADAVIVTVPFAEDAKPAVAKRIVKGVAIVRVAGPSDSATVTDGPYNPVAGSQPVVVSVPGMPQ